MSSHSMLTGAGPSKAASSSAFQLLSLGTSHLRPPPRTQSTVTRHAQLGSDGGSGSSSLRKKRKLSSSSFPAKEAGTSDAGKFRAGVEDVELRGSLDFFGTLYSAPVNAKSKIVSGDDARKGDFPQNRQKKQAKSNGKNEMSVKLSDEDEDEDGDEEDSEDEDDEEAAGVGLAPPPQKIKITGPDPLPQSFASLHDLLHHRHRHQRQTSVTDTELSANLLKNLHAHDVHALWGVQGAVAGALLANKDVMCIAPTGSGKTIAYLLPLYLQLAEPSRALKEHSHAGSSTAPAEGHSHRSTKTTAGSKAKSDSSLVGAGGIRSLILVPTHELALQTHAEVTKLAKGFHPKWRILLLSKATEAAVVEATTGGNEQQTAPAIDFLIATPERLHHLVEAGKVTLSSTRHLILDEADRLIGDDFLEQVEPIVQACSHPQVQKCLLSATIEAGPEAIARTWLREGGIRVVVGIKDAATTTIDQRLQFCGSESGKLMALRNDIAAGNLPAPALIFVQSIDRAQELYNELVLEGLQVDVIHSDRTRAKRTEALNHFKAGQTWYLIVTDVMSRGLDFKGVQVVVNYDMPQTVQSYVHRIGRTGRAGRTGKAITYFTLEDGPYLRTIANVMRTSGCAVEPWMIQLRKPSKSDKKKLKRAPPARKDISGKSALFAASQGKKRREMIEASKRRKNKGQRPVSGKTPTGSRQSQPVDLNE